MIISYIYNMRWPYYDSQNDSSVSAVFSRMVLYLSFVFKCGPNRGQSPVDYGYFLSIHLSVCLFVCLSILPFVRLSVCPFIGLPVISLSVCPFVHPFPLRAIQPGRRTSHPGLRPEAWMTLSCGLTNR